jgi:hypothetical protein
MDNTEGSRVLSQTLHVRKHLSYVLTDRQTEILIGSLLGDAYIHPLGKICFEQAECQLEYLSWKYREMQNLAYPKIALVTRFDHRKGTITKSNRFFLRQIFQSWRYVWYHSGCKHLPDHLEQWLTPLALAVWYMDDGHLDKGLAPLFACESFSLDETKLLAKILKCKYHFVVYVNKNKRIRFSRQSTKQFIWLVEPYILPCLRYKVTLTP